MFYHEITKASGVSHFRKLLGPGVTKKTSQGFTILSFNNFNFDEMAALFDQLAEKFPERYESVSSDRYGVGDSSTYRRLKMVGDWAKQFDTTEIAISKNRNFAMC